MDETAVRGSLNTNTDSESEGASRSPLIEPRPLSQTEFDQIYKAHQEWLSEPTAGAQADLQYCDLKGVKLPPNCGLQSALMSGASLVSCNLRNANLSDCDLRYANLKDTEFVRADFTGALLTPVRNLVSSQLSGTNLTRAQLPSEIGAFPAFENIGRITESVGKLVTSLLVAGSAVLLYAWTAPDADLISNVPARNNPLSSIEIPFLALGIIVPIVMFSVSLYLQIHMQRLWELLASLPAVFPDGRRLDERAPFWIGLGFVRAKAYWLTKQRPHLGDLQFVCDVFLLWWFVPIIMGLMWFRYLVCHEWHFSLLHSAMLAGSLVAAYSLEELASMTFDDTPGIIWGNLEGVLVSVRHGTIAFIIFGLFAGLSIVCTDFAAWPRAELQDSQVSTPPADLNAKDLATATEEQLSRVKGARLSYRNLQNSNAIRAFFVNADLHHSNLSGANFTRADLRDADLSEADLTHVILRGANVRGADFAGAILDGADLRGVDLSSVRNLKPEQLSTATVDAR